MKTLQHIIVAALCCLQLGFSSCLKEEDLNLGFMGYTPRPIPDGWELSTPEAEGIDPILFEKLFMDFYNEEKYPTIRSLLVVRNGQLVGEAYCKEASDGEQLHNLMSATKSITSMLAGIALDNGFIESLDRPVYEYLPSYFDGDEVKQSITIRHVLCMETGLDFNNDIHTSELLSGEGSSLDYILSQDLVFSPGSDWYYGDGNPQIISGLIKEVSGMSLSEFAREYLFQPLGIDEFQWESHPDGLDYGALGLWLEPRDMARIGLLMSNHGNWEGNRILSENWVTESTRRQSVHQNYGFYWYPIEDKAFYAEGHGGQIIWVYPEKQLVVVITSDPYTKACNLSEGYMGIFNTLLAALVI